MTSKMEGGPIVVEANGKVFVAQSKVAGWALLAFGLGLPAVALLSNRRLRRAPLPYLTNVIEGLGGGEAFFAGLAALFLLSLTLYGIFWLLWTRELSVDLATRRAIFRTGLWPRVGRIETTLDEFKTIHLWRKTYRPHKHVGPNRPDRYIESWEVRLSVPGCGEPLYLGEWGERREAAEEIERWRRVFPALRVEESDPSPEIRRPPE